LNIWTKNLIFLNIFIKNLVNLDKLKSFQPQINAANKLFRKTSHLSQKSKQTTKNNFTTLQEVLKASCNSRKNFKQQRKIFFSSADYRVWYYENDINKFFFSLWTVSNGRKRKYFWKSLKQTINNFICFSSLLSTINIKWNCSNSSILMFHCIFESLSSFSVYDRLFLFVPFFNSFLNAFQSLRWRKTFRWIIGVQFMFYEIDMNLN
jgi:hypothetical protein